ncbi:MAG: hypothetical protein J5J06_17065 [Phycisphaerae bacterium]|nr:hypothetical protein [Phycisphaerae bacterium]
MMPTYARRTFGTTTRGYNRFGGYTGTAGNRTTNRTRTTGTSQPTTAYKNVCNTFNNKISSYRTLINQTKGPAKFPRPTPTTLNNFANWIEKGAVVQTCSPQQVARWARTTRANFNPTTSSVTACKNVLTKKFGKNCIKAVARAKNGAFMVATAQTNNGKAFRFPK